RCRLRSNVYPRGHHDRCFAGGVHRCGRSQVTDRTSCPTTVQENLAELEVAVDAVQFEMNATGTVEKITRDARCFGEREPVTCGHRIQGGTLCKIRCHYRHCGRVRRVGLRLEDRHDVLSIERQQAARLRKGNRGRQTGGQVQRLLNDITVESLVVHDAELCGCRPVTA